MAKNQKYYAVRKGSVPGIYRTWESCKNAINGCSHAEFKSFSTEAEAQAFMKGDSVRIVHDIKDDNTVIAYTDGSFNQNTQQAGYGVVLITKDNEITLSGLALINGVSYTNLRQIAGEVVAAIKAIEYCEKNHFSNLIIYHDYIGISEWALGKWNANNPASQEYKRVYDNSTLNISFIKVPAHTNNFYNDKADQAAKLGAN